MLTRTERTAMPAIARAAPDVPLPIACATAPPRSAPTPCMTMSPVLLRPSTWPRWSSGVRETRRSWRGRLAANPAEATKPQARERQGRDEDESEVRNGEEISQWPD